MAPHENEEIVRSWFDELFDRKDLKALERLCADGFYDHTPPAGVTEGGLRAAREGFERLFQGLPDVRVKVEEIVSAGDRVFARTILTGTHSGDLMGLHACGKRLGLEVWHLFRLEGGKIAEHRAQSDTLQLLRQFAADARQMADVILIPPRDVPTTLA